MRSIYIYIKKNIYIYASTLKPAQRHGGINIHPSLSSNTAQCHQIQNVLQA